MEMSLLGYIVIGLALTSLILKREYILYYFIFFMPFTASAVLNFRSITYGVQPSYFFGIILLATWGVEKLRIGWKICVPAANRLLLIFTGVAAASLVLPFVFQGRILVVLPEGGSAFLHFSRVNLTQFCYLTFITLIVVFLTDTFSSQKSFFLKAVKVFLYSGMFVILWGWIQFVIISCQWPYPAWIFNNSMSMCQLWDENWYKVPRICSVCAEPSMYAHFMMTYLPVLFFVSFSRLICPTRRSQWYFRFWFGLGMTQVLISTSTSAYLGSIVLFVFIFYTVWKSVDVSPSNVRRLLKNFLLIFLTSGILSFGYLGWALGMGGQTRITTEPRRDGIQQPLRMETEKIRDVFRQVISEKMKSVSGRTRVAQAKMGLQVIKRTFGFGAGWGSMRTSDLGTTVLSQTGILGFAVFLGWLVMLISRMCVIVRMLNRHWNEWLIAQGFLIGFLCSIVINFIAIPDVIFLYFAFCAAAITVIGVHPYIFLENKT
ncbi:MAG: hypothetical protein A4E56_01875 [Pelotomaculum sp. PtaU1.Bin065]|nr:MAG: hypothetical protein A4E56_01875 [Pelotomaculum sp. PtaU1.Bin065]